jgi:hypothetical protein
MVKDAGSHMNMRYCTITGSSSNGVAVGSGAVGLLESCKVAGGHSGVGARGHGTIVQVRV